MFLRLLTVALLLAPAAALRAEAPRSNVVFVIVDDLRWDELGCVGHPFVQTPNIDRLAREGALFKNAFATTPLCSPSRASFLTGLYPHTHGVKDNTNNDARSHQLQTFLRLLNGAGYRTGFIGKWHMGTDDTPRPGIDHWIGLKGQGTYHDPEVNINGRRTRLRGYATDVFNAEAVAFLRQKHERPFALYLSHKAVHPETEQRADGSLVDPTASNFVPAERHRHLYAEAKVPRRPNALIDRLEGKPALMRRIGDLPPLSRATGTSDAVIRDRLRMLIAVDEGVGQITAALKEQGLLDRTLVIVTSDHGYYYGEHGLSVERRLPYEEGIRIPLVMRYPPLLRAGTTIEPMVLSLDIAPTLLALAGAESSARGMHGRSLLPILGGKSADWRTSFLVEHFSDTVFPRMEKMGYQAVRSDRHTYIQYRDLEGMDELYDLADDPYQIRNRISDPAMQSVLAAMRKELRRQLDVTP